MRRRWAARSLAFLSAALVLAAPASAGPSAASGHDWTRFGWSAARSSAPTFATGITAANVKSLVRQQVTLDGTVDSSPIYLRGIGGKDLFAEPFEAFWIRDHGQPLTGAQAEVRTAFRTDLEVFLHELHQDQYLNLLYFDQRASPY